jgi:hypothetical protein
MSRKFKFLLIGLMICLFTGSSVWAESLGELANDYVVVTGSPDAVTAGLIVNPDGRGDTLIFPYYDVRTINGKSQRSLFLIINESATGGGQDFTPQTPANDGLEGDGVDTGIIARIGFREFDKSIEVLDFHIYLSDEDVWVGEVTLNPITNVANLKSPDFVVIGSDVGFFYLNKPFTLLGQDFITSRINYTPFGGLTKEALTQMGYIEVIGEERVSKKATASTGTAPDTGVAYTHTVIRTLQDCPNNMMGTMYILRVNDGVAMGYNATALANFSRHQGSLFAGIGVDVPNLTFAEDSLDQVEFVLSKEDIFGAYSIESAIGATSSLLITFPTKHYHYQDVGTGTPSCRARIAGTDNPFSAACENDGEVVLATVWDREENKITVQRGFVSPAPVTPAVALPFEVNIIGFYPGTTATAVGRDNIAFPVGTFTSGWAWVNFPINNPVAGAKRAFPLLTDSFQYWGHLFKEYDGLPALALQVQEFTNNQVGGYFAEIFDAWYEVEWIRR